MNPVIYLRSTECEKRDPRRELREALGDVFPDKPLVIKELLRLLDATSCRYRPLNLNGCAETKNGVLACAVHSESIGEHKEVWNQKYEAYTYQLPTTSDGPGEPTTFVKGLLIGVVDSDASGSVLLSGKCWKGRGRLVIAPPPDARLRHSSVWIRDWRYIPSTSGSGIFEVLAKDVVCLSAPPQIIACFRTVGINFIAAEPVDNVRGFIRAKSCIVASKSPKPCFLLELAEFSSNAEDCGAVVIVFRGSNAVRWWPFLSVGQDVGVTAVRVAHLPRYRNRVVLKVLSSKSSCRVFQCAPHDEMPLTGNEGSVRLDPQLKRRRIYSKDGKMASTQTHCEQTLITYEGEITRVHADGKFELDSKVQLHLGEFKDSCASPGVTATCFRRGARIVASWVAFTARNGQLNLLPTGRTSIAIEYFGLLEFGWKRATGCHNNVWRWIWKRWNFPDIVWADDLYSSFRTKFGPWLHDVRNSDDLESLPEADIPQYLLGTRNSTGLIQFIMSLLSGRKELLYTDIAPSRDVYAEFLSPLLSRDVESVRPSTPSLLAVCEATQHLWRKHARGCLEEDKVPDFATIESQTQVVFQNFQILEALQSDCRNGSVVNFGLGQETMVLTGLLQGSSSGDRRMMLSDATASMHVKPIGQIPLTGFEAIVSISRFQVVAEAKSLSQSCQITFLFDASSIQVVVACSSSLCLEVSGLRESQTYAGQLTVSPGMLPSTFTKHATARTRITPTPVIGILEPIIANSPLVCIFVERLVPGIGSFTIAGHLVAVRESPLRENWTALNHASEQFAFCSLALSGESALKFAPGLHTNSLFAVSCTELRRTADPVQYLRGKVAECLYGRSTIELVTNFRSEVPCVLDLGQGRDMRFRAAQGHAHDHGELVPGFRTQRGPNRWGTAANEKHSPVAAAIERFSKGYMDSVVTSLWLAFRFRGLPSTGRDEQVLTLRGTVQQCDNSPDEGTSDNCASSWKLCIRDEQLPVFQIVVNFFDRRCTPQGLGPHMVVTVHNVNRVPTQVGSRFSFVGNMETFVEVVSVPVPKQGIDCQNCKCPPSGPTVFASLKYSTLWAFSEWKEAQKKRSCEAGVIRFRIVQIEHLQAKLMSGPSCSNCGVRQHKGDKCWNVAVSLVAIIEDGSATATLLCSGFRNVTKLLCASQEECMALKSMAVRESGFEMSRDFAESGLNVTAAKRSADNSMSVICKMMCRKRDERIIGLALNQTRLRPAGMSSFTAESDILMKGFRLGFGRLLWTSYSRRSSVVIECLAVYDCSARASGSVNDSLSIASTLRHLLEEHS